MTTQDEIRTRFTDLEERWSTHCKEQQTNVHREAGHIPVAEGGTAQFDMNIGIPRRIVCRERKCTWESEIA